MGFDSTDIHDEGWGANRTRLINRYSFIKDNSMGVSHKKSPVFVATVEKVHIQLPRFLHSQIGQAYT